MITFFTTFETASTRHRRQADISCGNVENHPCGWIRYHDGDWNSFNTNDLIENTLWVQFFLCWIIFALLDAHVPQIYDVDTLTATQLWIFTGSPVNRWMGLTHYFQASRREEGDSSGQIPIFSFLIKNKTPNKLDANWFF